MKYILLSALLLTGCTQVVYRGDVTPQERFGEECYSKPYINHLGDSYLCQANAISKLNKQVDLHNEAIK